MFPTYVLITALKINTDLNRQHLLGRKLWNLIIFYGDTTGPYAGHVAIYVISILSYLSQAFELHVSQL